MECTSFFVLIVPVRVGRAVLVAFAPDSTAVFVDDHEVKRMSYCSELRL